MSKVRGTLRPLKDKVIVHNMNFGEQISKGGIYIPSDNGKEQGIHPRWAQVFAKGSENTDPYSIGDWILVEHGRWTRGTEYESEDGYVTTIRMIDTDAVMMWSEVKPDDELLRKI